MNLRPVIERELRTSARLASTYYSRLVPGVLLLFAGVLVYGEVSYYASVTRAGSVIFGVLNLLLFCLIWLIVPLSTADLLSREKREDTLGLLLLTPLRPFEVVLAKALGGLLRGMALILAVLPIVAIPILLGGVTPMDLLRVTFLNLSALVGAVCAGVVVSSFCVRRGRAWFVAFVAAAFFAAILYSLHLVFMDVSQPGLGNTNYFLREIHHTPLLLPFAGWIVSTGYLELWKMPGFGSTPLNVAIAGLVLLTSITMTGFGVMIAARQVRRFSDEGQLTERQQKVQRLFTEERLFVRFLQSSRRRLLERNPSAWLIQRRWSARLARWGWSFLSVALVTVAVIGSGHNLDLVPVTCVVLGIFMLVSLLLISATSLQDERDSGALELLLVTHLSPVSFVAGRWQGIMRTFIPGLSLVVVIHVFTLIYWLELHSRGNLSWQIWNLMAQGALVMFVALLLLYLPVIGLCFSLCRRNPLAACLDTLLFGVLIPWLAPVFMFGAGVFLHLGLTGQMDDDVPFVALLSIFVGSLALFQGGLYLVKKKRGWRGMPNVWPRWFIRMKIGWLLPWLGPVAVMIFLQLGGETWISRTRYNDHWGLGAWQLSAWVLLVFIGTGCHRALVQMLGKRLFVAV